MHICLYVCVCACVCYCVCVCVYRRASVSVSLQVFPLTQTLTDFENVIVNIQWSCVSLRGNLLITTKIGRIECWIYAMFGKNKGKNDTINVFFALYKKVNSEIIIISFFIYEPYQGLNALN